MPEVRLIDENGAQVGVVNRDDALNRATAAGMDLVEVAPEARPPVCKIMDYTKFKYQKAIRERQARKKQVRIDIKEVKFRPATDTHDFEVKMRSILKFLEEGNKVKCTLRFRGREMAHQELGLELLKRVETLLIEIAKVEQYPRLLGRQMTMVMAPLPNLKPVRKTAPATPPPAKRAAGGATPANPSGARTPTTKPVARLPGRGAARTTTSAKPVVSAGSAEQGTAQPETAQPAETTQPAETAQQPEQTSQPAKPTQPTQTTQTISPTSERGTDSPPREA